jgi:hypothetical protein
MPPETVLEGVPEPPPEDDDRDLRPQTMHDMVGQCEVRERLGIAGDAAQKRGRRTARVPEKGISPNVLHTGLIPFSRSDLPVNHLPVSSRKTSLPSVWILPPVSRN